MAETHTLERIYTIPLRLALMKVPQYKRARKGIVTIKEFIARHMKVPNRDVDNVRLDTHLNNHLWFRGPSNAPARVTVKATKKGDIVHVTFAETPAYVGFAKSKHTRLHKKAEKKAAPAEAKEEVKTTEEKKAETEKEQSVAIVNEKAAEQQAKDAKHTTKAKTPQIKRMALKK